MHLKRWITSLIAIPVLVTLIVKGSGLIFAAFIAVVAALALYEYFTIVFKADRRRIFSPIALSAVAVGVLMMWAAAFGQVHALLGLVVLGLAAAALLSMPVYEKGPQIMETVGLQIQGVVYIPLALSTLVLLRAQPQGLTWIFFVLLVVFLGDVGAFYVGTYRGRHKLIAAVSPGKTIEGALGGLAANLVVAVVFQFIFLPGVSTLSAALLGVIMGAVGQVGDLFESELKRSARIKDSGAILPGHGGLLDRIDALLFAAPVAYAWKMLFF